MRLALYLIQIIDIFVNIFLGISEIYIVYLFYMCNVHCISYNVHCALNYVMCTMYTVHCTMYIVHCTLYMS